MVVQRPCRSVLLPQCSATTVVNYYDRSIFSMAGSLPFAQPITRSSSGHHPYEQVEELKLAMMNALDPDITQDQRVQVLESHSVQTRARFMDQEGYPLKQNHCWFEKLTKTFNFYIANFVQ